MLRACLFVIITGVSVALAQTRPATAPAVDEIRELRVGELVRSYRAHIPRKLDRGRPAPVVLIFHGAGMNAARMAILTGMDRKADAEGFVAVYPDGTGAAGGNFLIFNAWDTGRWGTRADDVAFTRALLDDLATVVNVDAKRVFATGLSNGGFMCYRLAAELSDRIAAIAPVAGTLALRDPRPTRPVPVLHIHGTEDRLVPYDGPVGSALPFRFFGVEATVHAWARLNGCDPEPVVQMLPDTADDGTRVQRGIYGNGREGSEVILLHIEGGGHTWPGRPVMPRMLGRTSMDFAANDVIWEFFCRHPMP